MRAAAVPAGFTLQRRFNGPAAVAAGWVRKALLAKVPALKRAALRAMRRVEEEEAAAEAARSTQKTSTSRKAAKETVKATTTTPPAAAAATPNFNFNFNANAFGGGFLSKPAPEAPASQPTKAAATPPAKPTKPTKEAKAAKATAPPADNLDKTTSCASSLELDDTPRLLSIATGMAEKTSPSLLMLSKQLKGRRKPSPLVVPAPAPVPAAPIPQVIVSGGDQEDELRREIARLKTSNDLIFAERAGLSAQLLQMQNESDALPRKYLTMIEELRGQLREAQRRSVPAAAPAPTTHAPAQDQEVATLRREKNAAREEVATLQKKLLQINGTEVGSSAAEIMLLRATVRKVESQLAVEKSSMKGRDERLNNEIHRLTTELREKNKEASESHCKAERDASEAKRQLREGAEVSRNAVRELLFLLGRLRSSRLCTEDPRQLQDLQKVERRIKEIQSTPASALSLEEMESQTTAANADALTQLAAVQTDLAKANAQLRTLEAEATSQQARLTTATTVLDQTRSQANQAQSKAQKEVLELKEKLRVASAQAESAGEVSTLRTELARLKATHAEMTGAASIVQGERDDLKEEVNKLRRDSSFLTKEIEYFKGVFADKMKQEKEIGVLRHELNSAKKSVAEGALREQRHAATENDVPPQSLQFSHSDDLQTPKRNRPTLRVPVVTPSRNSSAATVPAVINLSDSDDEKEEEKDRKRSHSETTLDLEDGASSGTVHSVRLSLQNMMQQSWTDADNEILAAKYLRGLNEAETAEQRAVVFKKAAKELGKEKQAVENHVWANKEMLAELAGVATRDTPRRPSRVIDAEEERTHFDEVTKVLNSVDDVDDATSELACTVLMELTGRSKSFVAARI